MNTVAQLEEALRASNTTHLLAMAGANEEIAQLRRDKAALSACCEKYERVMAQLRKERDAYFSRLCQYEVPPTPNEIDASAVRDGIRPNSPFAHHHV